MIKQESHPITVAELAFEIALAHADSNFGKWEEIDCDNSTRRIIYAGMHAAGNPSLGIPGIIPHIVKLTRDGTINVRGIGNNLEVINADDIAASQKSWYVSQAHANIVRKNLLPEKIRHNIERKAKLGRYTLEEASELIAEGWVTDEDEADEPIINCFTITPMLMDAAFKRLLPVYLPGSDVPYEYGGPEPRAREYFEEAYWYDLNQWLKEYLPLAKFSFPDPSHSSNEDEWTGVPKWAILAVDWPLPAGSPKMKSILNDQAKWVEEAVRKCGRRGKGRDGSHLWNPADLAICLVEKTTHKRWTVNKKALTNVIKNNFPAYLAKWEAKSEYLESGS